MFSSLDHPYIERRARSASPSKNHRHEMYHLATQSLHSFDELITTNGTAFDRTKLKKLAKSPISKKLHVSTGPLGNPIPFQLQLPPRLSKSTPGSPNSTKGKQFPTKMIFNGQEYEPYFSDDLVLDVDIQSKASAVNEQKRVDTASPEKPPSLGNRKKVAKFAEKNNVLLLHQLSIIRELSMRIASQKAITLGKALPQSPPSNEMNQTRRKLLDNLSAQASPKPSFLPTSQSQPLLAPIAKAASKARPVDTCKLSDSAAYLTEDLCHNTSNTAMGENAFSHQRDEYNDSEFNTQPLRLPNSAAFHHNLFMGDSSAFKVEKRTFSDESTVSSVSSFSSIGDAFVQSCQFMSNPSLAPQPRLKPSVSRFSNSILGPHPPQLHSSNGTPNKSFASLKYSNDTTPAPVSRISSKCSPQKNGTSKDTMDSEATPTKSATQVCKSTSERTIPTIAPDDSVENMQEEAFISGPNNDNENNLEKKNNDEIVTTDAANNSIDDNCGAGMRFNFPNDGLNMTNNEEARRRSLKNHTPRRKSFKGYMTPQGQIEIPKLCEESPLKGKGFQSLGSDIHDEESMSDSESSFNSQFSMLQAKKFQKKHMPFSKSMGAIPTPATSITSPVKHTRQKSMFSINVAELELDVSPLKTKSRALGPSLDCKATYGQVDLKPVVFSNTVDAEEKNAVEEELEDKITVNEPPKKVAYAVDFRSTNSISRSPRALNYTDSYSDRLKKLVPPLSNPSYYNQTASETNSSYKSSRSGIETASTAASETESVTIDLTKERYDVCLVKRQDSTLSYKSVIENTRDGQKVEVVLVDDEEEEAAGDRDDLLSIYSRYIGGWSKFGVSRLNLSTKETTEILQRLRNNSILSEASEESDCSANSWAAGSTTNFQVKQAFPTKAPIVPPKTSNKELKEVRVRKGIPPKRKAPVSSDWQDIEEEEACNMISEISIKDDVSYFDYSQGGKYDFESYMKQGLGSRVNNLVGQK